MFEIGSYVSYRAEGVCVIADIRNESFGAIGASTKYYILSPLNDEKSTVFVPAENELLMGYMRPLLSAAEIHALIEEQKEERLEWIEESRARNVKYRDLLAEGDRRVLITLVQTILDYAAAIQPKKLGSTDENALKRATRMLYEEFSATTDLAEVEEILPLLRGERILKPKK